MTGASSGIGIAIAKALANAGANVACVARSEDKLKTVVDEINGSSSAGKAIAVVGDVSKPGSPKTILSKVDSELGPVDILVNNAGIARIGALIQEPEDLDIWWKTYEVNVRAPVAMMRAALPSMLERKTGYLITISSNVATLGLPAMAPYASSKAAISKYHESLGPELEGTGVTSFAVHPGMVQTNLGGSDFAINKDSMEHPAVKAFMSGIGPDIKYQSSDLAANVTVALTSDEKCKKMSGRHINVDQDLEPVVEEAQKEDLGKIGKERLYLVNIASL